MRQPVYKFGEKLLVIDHGTEFTVELIEWDKDDEDYVYTGDETDKGWLEGDLITAPKPEARTSDAEVLRVLQCYLDRNEPNGWTWEEDSSAEAWLGEGHKSIKQFHVFADRDGSLLALWKSPGSKLEHAPVVCLGSEGELGLLGRNLPEALALLAATGEEHLMMWFPSPAEEGVTVKDPGKEVKNPECDKDFQDWVKTYFGIPKIKSPYKHLLSVAESLPALLNEFKSLRS